MAEVISDIIDPVMCRDFLRNLAGARVLLSVSVLNVSVAALIDGSYL